MTIRGLDAHITGNYGEDQLRHTCPRCGAFCRCDGEELPAGNTDATPLDQQIDPPFICAHKCPPERTWEDLLCPECQSSPCACDRGLS